MKKILISLFVILFVCPVFALTDKEKATIKNIYYYELAQGFDKEDAKEMTVQKTEALGFEAHERCNNYCMTLGNLYFSCIEKCPPPEGNINLFEVRKYVETFK